MLGELASMGRFELEIDSQLVTSICAVDAFERCIARLERRSLTTRLF